MKKEFKKGDKVKFKYKGFTYIGKYVKYDLYNGKCNHEVAFPSLSISGNICLKTLMLSNKEISK